MHDLHQQCKNNIVGTLFWRPQYSHYRPSKPAFALTEVTMQASLAQFKKITHGFLVFLAWSSFIFKVVRNISSKYFASVLLLHLNQTTFKLLLIQSVSHYMARRILSTVLC